jgi:hypothetical protein
LKGHPKLASSFPIRNSKSSPFYLLSQILNLNSKNEIVKDGKLRVIDTLDEKFFGVPGDYAYHVKPAQFQDGRIVRAAATSGCLAYSVDHVREMIWIPHSRMDMPDKQDIGYARAMFPLTHGKFVNDQWFELKQEGSKLLPIPVQPFESSENLYLNTYPLSHIVSTSVDYELIARWLEVLDIYMGVPWILLDQDPLSIQRAKDLKPSRRFLFSQIVNYSNYKLFAPCLLSSAILIFPPLTWMALALMREARAIAEAGLNFRDIASPDQVSIVVNNHDLKGAVEIWKDLRKVVTKIFTPLDEQYGRVWFSGYCPSDYLNLKELGQYSNSIEAFEKLVLAGGWTSHLKHLEDNWWIKTQAGFAGHSTSVKVWERWIKATWTPTKEITENNIDLIKEVETITRAPSRYLPAMEDSCGRKGCKAQSSV